MPFAIIGIMLALRENPNGVTVSKIILIILCMVFARSAAMAFNRYIDRYFDANNPRTANREIPSGQIRETDAFVFIVISSSLFIICTFFINLLCFCLAPVALAVILGYSYTKRFTPLCHLVLGVGLSLAPIGAYIAITETFSLVPILFSCIVFTWVSGFDIIYALQDEEFDKSQELNSIPAFLGKEKALLVARVLHTITAFLVVFAGIYGMFSWLYLIGAAVFIGLLVFQHTLVKPNDLSKVTLAFGTTNGIASVIFAVFVCLDILL